MVYLNRLYTRSGDAGSTQLGDGQAISKTNPRIIAMGAIDELNAAIGVVVSGAMSDEHRTILLAIQNDLFDLGAELCLPAEPFRIHATRVERLEQWLDLLTPQRPPLTSFILPGGTPTAAQLHLARTIARRAEIDAVTLHAQEPLNPQLITYLNRLSDLLFALARVSNPPDQSEPQWIPTVD